MNFKIILVLLALFLSPLVNADTGTMVLFDAQGQVQEIQYSAEDGYAVAEGDILLQKLPENNSNILPQALLIAEMGGKRWENGEIPFVIDSQLSVNCAYAIREAISNWQNQVRLSFIERTEENANQYPDYIHFVPTASAHSSSFVGRQGGEQLIKIAADCRVMSIVHEIGHALGLWHEHSRRDRDDFIDIKWENVAEQHIFNFKQHLNDGQDIGLYDYDSIMHYSSYAFSKNGLMTIVPKQGDAKIGQRDHLSFGDIQVINEIYF